VIVGAVGQQAIERPALHGGERAADGDEMPIVGRNGCDGVSGSGAGERGMGAWRRGTATSAWRPRSVRRCGICGAKDQSEILL
jgi:hypothetical protein